MINGDTSAASIYMGDHVPVWDEQFSSGLDLTISVKFGFPIMITNYRLVLSLNLCCLFCVSPMLAAAWKVMKFVIIINWLDMFLLTFLLIMMACGCKLSLAFVIKMSTLCQLYVIDGVDH